MAESPPTLSQIKAQVQAIHAKLPHERIIGLSVPTPVQGAQSFTLGGELFQVHGARSALEIREQLLEFDPKGASLVILTTASESDLGYDLKARLAKGKLFTIYSWDIIKTLFSAQHVDPALIRHRCLADVLIELSPGDGYSPVPAGVLDQDTAWDVILRGRLGFEGGHPDLVALLKWCMYSDKVERWGTLGKELADLARLRITATAGLTATSVLNCVECGRGTDSLPIGLACRVLFDSEAGGSPDLREASVRLEQYNAGQPLERQASIAWASAAEVVIDDLVRAHSYPVAKPWLERADQLLRDLRADAFAYLSETSPEGFCQRLSRYARVLSSFLDGDLQKTPEDLVTAARAVISHDQAAVQPEARRRVVMSLRLARWLAAFSHESPPASLREAVYRYAADGGFVDWGRCALASSEPVEELSLTYAKLRNLITERREAENERFAKYLAGWAESDDADASLLRTEDVLNRVVAPLARIAPVLLIVMDGMSFGVARELLNDLTAQGWVEHAGQDGQRLPPVVAAIPSATEVCRASLFAGKLMQGDNAKEKAEFQGHPALLPLCSSQAPPILFHKAELAGEGGTDLRLEVRRQIASPRRKVVGVVVNAVDDHLLKGDQIYPTWTSNYIPILQALLRESQQADRIVILTSDHGHVLEAGTEMRPYEEGERWRCHDGSVGNGEVAVRGRRVVGMGPAGIIAPWSERIRYGSKKNGYHGGVSPQEMVVPIAVLTASGRDLDGWPAVSTYYPDWWDDQISAVSIKREGVPTVAVQPKPAPKIAETLFDLKPETEQPKAARESWINLLMASEVFVSQSKLVARSAPTADGIAAFLAALDERGGKMTVSALAHKLGKPNFRVNGMIAVMRRLLNVDGYPILERDEASDSIELNRELLRSQFGIVE